MGVVVLHLDGEIDIASVGFLRNAIFAAMSLSDGPIALDCAELTFIGATGLGTLVWFANQSKEQHRAPSLRRVSPTMQRLLDLTGIGHLFSSEVVLSAA